MSTVDFFLSKPVELVVTCWQKKSWISCLLVIVGKYYLFSNLRTSCQCPRDETVLADYLTSVNTT